MRWNRRFSIYYKINTIVVSMLLLLSLTIGIIMVETTGVLLDQQIEKRGSEVASNIAVLSSNDILLDDHYSLSDRINRTKYNVEDIRYILVTDSLGRVIAHTFPDNLPIGLPVMLPSIEAVVSNPYSVSHPDNAIVSNTSPYWVSKFSSNEGPIREIAVPIESGIGFVRVGMSEKSTQQLLAEKTGEFFFVTLMACFLAVIASAYLARIIIKPIGILVQAAQEIRRGNFSIQTERIAKDEIGDLTAVFNEMANSLKQKDMENNQLLSALKEKETMRTVLINKLFSVQEEERKRLSRELHDETGQSLISLLAYMKVLKSKLNNKTQMELLQGARNLVIDVLDGVRKTAVELRPPILDDLGIIAAMTKCICSFSSSQGITVDYIMPEDKLYLSNETSLTLYRILQEGLTNVAKHAQATFVFITLSIVDSEVVLKIEDNGVGMKPGVLLADQEKEHLGIYGMRERVELVGGTLFLESSYGEGTTIIVTLPI
ncbi:MAG: integral rane sensor signal transduction histidine kinase [Firmicutes bacterium]|nr:integral rane sensor signal transduction histidine kinase [Bacillota bacterium]